MHTLRTLTALASTIMLASTLAIAAAPASQAAAKPRVKVTTVVKSRSATTVRTIVKIRVKTSRRGNAIKVRVKVGSKSKTIKARWSGGAYRGVARIVTPKPAKTVVKTLGVTKRVKAKKIKTRAKKIIVDGKRATSTTTATVTATPGATVEITGQLEPARGRIVQVQRKTGTAWRTETTLHTRNAVRVMLTATVPASTTPTTWRLYAPATPSFAAATIATANITPTATTPTDPGTTPVDPGIPGGGTDPVIPEPIDWQPGQRNCLDTTGHGYTSGGVYYEVNGAPIPDCTDYGPATIEAISTVADRFMLDDRCGVTITCWREPTPNEIANNHDPNELVRWSPPPTIDTFNDANPEVAYMPETVAALNQLAIDKGWITQAEIDTHGPPFREIKTPLWDQFPHSTAPGYGIVLGHGGPTQAHAASRALGRTIWEVSVLPFYSNNTTFGFHSIPGAIGTAMDTAYPVTPYKWSCSEQGWTVNASVHDILHRLDTAHENDLEAQVTDYIAVGYRGAAYVTHAAYRWSTGQAVEWANFCRLSNRGQTETHPDGYTIYSPATLPGDPWG